MSDDDNLLIWHITKDRRTEEIINSIFLRDSDQDFRPDIFSNNGTDWFEINLEPQEAQEQIILMWTLDMAHFGSYLLNY